MEWRYRRPPSVLIISPAHRTPLNTPLPGARPEVQAVTNQSGLDTKVLLDHVTKQDLIDTITKYGPFDILWFVTHGTEHGIELSDGELLTNQDLVPVVRQARASLLFINTCESLRVGIQLMQETQVDVICTITDVDDELALLTGVRFAGYLSEKYTYRQAYDQSLPGGNLDYIYLEAPPSRRFFRDAAHNYRNWLLFALGVIALLLMFTMGVTRYYYMGYVTLVHLAPETAHISKTLCPGERVELDGEITLFRDGLVRVNYGTVRLPNGDYVNGTQGGFIFYYPEGVYQDEDAALTIPSQLPPGRYTWRAAAAMVGIPNRPTVREVTYQIGTDCDDNN